MESKYIALFVLHALGDTLGFKNRDWKLNYNIVTSLDSIYEFIFEFIDLGGINGIDLQNWIISSNTYYHMAIAKSVLKFNNKFDKKYSNILKDNLIYIHNKMIDDENETGICKDYGTTLNRVFKKFTENIDARHLPYDYMSGGNNTAVRNLCIGLAFYKESDLNQLIDLSIQSSKITHNSPLGFLAGFTSAYFTSLAVREIQINKWIFMMLELIESDKIKKYINNSFDEQNDYNTYIRYWKKYIDTRFIDTKPIKSRSISNMIFRIKYYYENFVKDSHADYIGSSGFCSMIMVYDALIDCDGKFEKLIFYSILHPGDSDVIGAIACGLYGIIYGFGDVPQTLLSNIEKKDKLIKLGKQFHKKYFKKI